MIEQETPPPNPMKAILKSAFSHKGENTSVLDISDNQKRAN